MALTATAMTSTVLRPLPAELVNFSGNGVNGAVGMVFIGAFATVGALLAWKRPQNPIGWLLSAIGLEYAVAVFSVLLAHFPRTVTLASWLGFLYLLGFGLCVLVVLLFPTGTLPSRRWRPVAWAAVAGVAAWVLGCAFAPTIVTTSPTTPNPVGVTGPAGDIFKVLAAGGALLFVVTGLAAVLSLVFRYRRAQAAERAQLRWLVYAGALIVVAVAASLLIGPIMGSGDSANNLQNALGSGAVALVPVAIGIAVLRYRLHAGRRGSVHPGTAAGAEPGGPAVQPGPVRRRPDRSCLRRPAERHGRPELGPRRPDRRRVPRARAGPRIGVDQPSSGPTLTSQLLTRKVRVGG
jgi:hypothetical protein